MVDAFDDFAFGVNEAGVLHGFFGSYEGKLGVSVVFACFLAVEVLVRIEAFDFAGKLGFEFRSVEVGDGGSAADTFFEGFDVFSYVIPDGIDGSETRSYYFSQFHKDL